VGATIRRRWPCIVIEVGSIDRHVGAGGPTLLFVGICRVTSSSAQVASGSCRSVAKSLGAPFASSSNVIEAARGLPYKEGDALSCA
jgi:hypothetical protein